MTRRIRIGIAVAVVLLVSLVGVPAVKAMTWAPWWSTPDETLFINWLNGQRSWYGRQPLIVDPVLTTVARNHAQQLANSGTLWHQDLRPLFAYGWTNVGENVGYAGDCWLAHVALSYSPPHLRNMLGNFKGVGVGAVRSGGRVYVVQVFGNF